LYSAQKLIETVARCPMDRDQYLWSFRTMLVSPAEGVLSLSTRCGWIGINEQLGLDVTPLGRAVQELGTQEGRLRRQIRDYIQAVQPPWAKLIPGGRDEALPFMPLPARECFYHAALDSSPPDDEVIAWWDQLAAAARGQVADYLALVGREGERCSIRYEELRVGQRPEWHSIESNKSGFDLLSVATPADPSELRIEVKASERPVAFAKFHVTRNEWEVAQSTRQYVFHVWSLTQARKALAVLTPSQVAAHMSTDQGEGRWETVEIPYGAFENRFVAADL
jgi:hypothetical protein